MVQVLPAVPGFGEKLTEVLSQAGGQITKALQKRSAMHALEKYFPQNLPGAVPGQQPAGAAGSPTSPMAGMPQQRPQISPLQIPQIYQLGVDAYGEDAAKQFVGSLLKQQENTQAQADKLAKEQRKNQSDIEAEERAEIRKNKEVEQKQ